MEQDAPSPAVLHVDWIENSYNYVSSPMVFEHLVISPCPFIPEGKFRACWNDTVNKNSVLVDKDLKKGKLVFGAPINM